MNSYTVIRRKRVPKKKLIDEFNYVIKPKVIKICVVGDSNCGKTSLIRKYLYGAAPRHYQGTIGYDYDVQRLNRQNKDVRLEIYDTGHPIYNDMVFKCISEYSIDYVVICYDLLNKHSFKVVSDWINAIQEFGRPNRHKILICGTKSDMLDIRQKSILVAFLGVTLRNRTLGYYETSAKLNQNIYSDYNEDLNRNYLDEFNSPNKRACVRRGGNCDHRPNDCCYNSSCRCNLWGSNCRCQRMGLFQKWG